MLTREAFLSDMRYMKEIPFYVERCVVTPDITNVTRHLKDKENNR